MGQELFMATTIDPLFLVLPSLAENQSRGSEQKRLFLSSDDHFDKLPEESSHLSEILRCDKTRKLMEARMGAICDTVEAGDETMFRLNEEKLSTVILNKAKKMSEGGLPPSMEDKFVKKTLEAPILTQKRVVKTTEVVAEANGDTQNSTPTAEESQSTVTSTGTTGLSESQPSTAATSFTEETTTLDSVVSAMMASPEVVELQRMRVAFDFICCSYIGPMLSGQLQESLAKETCSINFTPLEEYLAKLSKLRAEALSSRSVDYSRKRGRDEDDDEARAEKKRKMEEEKKRKASESRGVRDLKKVNTKGMKKMSDFFKKK